MGNRPLVWVAKMAGQLVFQLELFLAANLNGKRDGNFGSKLPNQGVGIILRPGSGGKSL
jgi:hypothetical protein